MKKYEWKMKFMMKRKKIIVLTAIVFICGIFGIQRVTKAETLEETHPATGTFLQNGNEQENIYYKTENGNITEVSQEDLDIAELVYVEETVTEETMTEEIEIEEETEQVDSDEAEMFEYYDADIVTATKASGQCGDNLNWSLNSSGVLTVSGTGKMWDYRDDADYFDYHECPWSSYREQITSVKLKSGVTYIGADAFAYCSNLKQITFCETLTSIAPFAFFNCSNLEDFTLPTSLQALGQQAFCNCKKITTVTIPDAVTFLDAGIFDGDTALVNVYIGGSTEADVYISSNCIFRNCTALESIEVSENNLGLTEIDGVLFTSDKEMLTQYPLGRKDTSYQMPDTTKTIFQLAIEGAVYLENVVFPEGLTSIENLNFSYCENLKSLTIPSSVTTLGELIGAGCVNLEYIENKSSYTLSLPDYAGLAFVNASGKQIYSIKNGTAYQCGVVSAITMDSTKELKVGATSKVPSSFDYINLSVKENVKDLVFTSTNTDVVKVSSSGKITAVSPGTATIKVKARCRQNSSTELISKTCKVTVKNDFTKASVSTIKDQNYTGSEIKPTVTVKYSGVTLKSGTDYSVTYKSNTEQGKATAVITGKGNYSGTIKKTFSIKVSKDKTYTVDNYKYLVTNANTDGTGTVTISGTTLSKSKLTKLTIGAAVDIGGISYKITAIGASAFSDYTKLTEVKIGKQVTSIGKEAFCGDTQLKNIVIKSSKLKTVGKNAWKRIPSSANFTVPSKNVNSYKELFTSSTGYKSTMKIVKA